MRLWIAVLALAACEPPPDVEPIVCESAEPGRAELGLGDRSTGFLPLEDGTTVNVVLGPQGLHMIVLAMRLEDFELPTAGSPRTLIRMEVLHEGQLFAGTEEPVPPIIRADGTVEYLGIRTIVQVAEVVPYEGAVVEASGTVFDGCGRPVLAKKTLRLHITNEQTGPVGGM